MIKQAASAVLVLAASLSLTACGGGGGGGGPGNGAGSNPSNPPDTFTQTQADLEVKTYATVGSDGSWARVDLVDGGQTVSAGGPLDPGNLPPNPAKRTLLARLQTTSGIDLDGNLADTNGDGLGDLGFDTYSTGHPPGALAARIIGANNLYDLFQTTTGAPQLFNGNGGGPPFDGGDADGDGVLDGGPGLFSNMDGNQQGNNGPTVSSLIPKLPTLPNAMGTNPRAASATDQHQFIQIEFPYNLDRGSLFDPFRPANSFLGDSNTGLQNVFVEDRHVERAPGGDTVNIIDQLPRHVTVVAVIGGTASLPLAGGGFATIDPASLDPASPTNPSNIPQGARRLIGRNNVLTLIAHENPVAIAAAVPGTSAGFVAGDGTLVLPDPTADPAGGRVFGGGLGAHPGDVNDFATFGDQTAARIGFVSVRITDLRAQGTPVKDPYFHSFPMSQENVGSDPLAVRAKPQGNTNTFNRGPAIPVDSITGEPAIDVLSVSKDYLPPYNPTPVSDASNTISTRARFRIDFDKEVVPNSVGFSRRHTIHSTPTRGVVFPFNGNARPIESPALQFVTGALGSPLAPSVYLAVNQPLTGANPQQETKTNNPYAKAGPPFLRDDGTPIDPSVVTNVDANRVGGLYPAAFNTGATLPRGVVPVDIFPINQNNLQSYVLQPLVELPPGAVVTIGVCRPGLGTTNNTLNATFALNNLALNAIPFQPTNHGNFTRAGTMYTPWQGLTPVGLGDNTVSLKQAVIGDQTVIKVNAGPIDLEGNLFYGGTTVAIDMLIDGDPGGDSNDQTTGFFNVSRTFKVGNDAQTPYVNSPVAPQAMVVGFAGGNGVGVLDLCGTGFNTNAPDGAGTDVIVLSRFLQQSITGILVNDNWQNGGSLAFGNHQAAYGITSRYVAPCFCPGAISTESEFAVASAIPTGFGTPTPGINEGSSGFETMVKNSFGSEFLTKSQGIQNVRDLLLGDFLDTIYFDKDNPFGVAGAHRSYNTPTQTGVLNNMIADPPLPNPPPLRFPVGLNHTYLEFDQDNLLAEPFIIDGNEVFNSDNFMSFDDGTGITPGSQSAQALIQIDPSYNASNPNNFDIPPLPNTGYPSPFAEDAGQIIKFVQTGPLPETSTAGAALLSFLNQAAIGSAAPGGLVPPIYQSRQQIGNFLFVTDGINKKLHAVNSNNMKILQSLSLPDPYGLAMTPDLEVLYVSNEGDNTVSVVDCDPRSMFFMQELKRIPVGEGPRAIAVTPDREDVFVLNRIGNTISIIDVPTNTVRRTITQSGINRPEDITLGLREVAGGPAFQSGTFHGFISNGGGNNILVYEGGPSGQAGIGFDNILGQIRPNQPATLGQPVLRDMANPRGIVYDPIAPLDAFAGTVGAFVAHQDPVSGVAMISRAAYTKDSNPGQFVFNSINNAPSFGEKIFEITQQYVSTSTGTAFDVGLIDYNRDRLITSNFGTNFNLYNAGATLVIIAGLNIPRNAKYPQAGQATGGVTNNFARWEPDRVYLSSGGKRIDVFDVDTAQPLKTIPTAADVAILCAYFEQ